MMRRLAIVAGTVLAVLWVSAPAHAFFHNGVTNPYLHAVLDVLTLTVVTAPLVAVRVLLLSVASKPR